jgi:HK97 family phage major capsid protein
MIIDTNLQEITAIRPYVTNYRIPNPSLTIPVITDPGQAGWFQEGGDDLEEDESFKGGTVDLKPHGSYAYFAIDRHMLMYSYIPLLPMMKDMYMRQFQKLHGAGFVNGSGVQRPIGFMNDTNVEVINQEHATLILNLDKVQELWWSLKSFYKENAKYIMNSMTGYVLANLKDGIGNYILRPITENQKFNICGKQVIFSEDMPDIGPGTHPILIADWKPFYHVIESTGGNWAIEDQFTKKKKSIIEYVFTKFIGGRPVVSEAAKKLRIAV